MTVTIAALDNCLQSVPTNASTEGGEKHSASQIEPLEYRGVQSSEKVSRHNFLPKSFLAIGACLVQIILLLQVCTECAANKASKPAKCGTSGRVLLIKEQVWLHSGAYERDLNVGPIPHSTDCRIVK